MNLIDSIPISHYKPIEFRNEHIWKNHDLLNLFINNNFSIEFKNILAKPFSSNKIFNWYSLRQGQFKTLDTYTIDQKQKCLLIYHGMLKTVRDTITALKESVNTDNLIWAELLSKLFSPENNIIYFNGQEIILLWGFEFNNLEENYVDPLILNDYLNKSNAVNLLSETKIEQNELSEVKNISDSKSLPGQNQNEDFTLSKRIIVRSSKLEKSKERFLYKYWWTLLVLILLISSIFIYFNKIQKLFIFNKNSSLEQILPSNPLVRPKIDTSKIVNGDNGTTKIISNLFNIALTDKTQHLSDFVIDLKKIFSDSVYQVVFYDTTISRIQFQFPDTDRNSLKEKIKKDLDKYNILIWDESIFSSYRTFNDPIFNYPDQSWYLMAVGAPAAWNISTGDINVVIAIIDDGFDLNNEDLKNNIINPYNIKSRNNIITADTKRFHGTHVAGIALGKANNSYGVSGIAPDCSFMPIQISDQSQIFTSSDVVDGILYAIKNNADVINLSLGKYYSNEIEKMTPQEQLEFAQKIGKDEAEFWDILFSYAEKENVVIVMASGNQHLLIGIDPMQRSEKAIKVSAMNKRLVPTAFSNYGSGINIYAPGENIYGLYPGNQEIYLDGTSMASPIVAGTIALMKSRKKDLTNKEIFQLLRNTGEPLNDKTGVNKYIRIDKLLSSF